MGLAAVVVVVVVVVAAAAAAATAAATADTANLAIARKNTDSSESSFRAEAP